MSWRWDHKNADYPWEFIKSGVKVEAKAKVVMGAIVKMVPKINLQFHLPPK